MASVSSAEDKIAEAARALAGIDASRDGVERWAHAFDDLVSAVASTDYHRGKLDGRREALEEVRALIDAALARDAVGELEWARLGGLTRDGEAER